MNVAIYARVSTAAQAEKGYSLETQVEACRQKAVSLGADNIKNYIDDGYSGAYLERPALDDLRDALAAGLHDTVIVYDTDRLARDTMLLLLLTEEIEKCATLMFVNTEYNKTPEGQLFYEIKGSFAKYERIRIQDRFARGRRGKLRRGLPLMDSHVFGYDFIDGKYVINEYEANIVRMIFDFYINSVGGQKNVVKMLKEKGVPAPMGAAVWRLSTVCNILRREQYTGEYYALKVYRKKTSAHKTTDIPRDKSEWIAMSCPGIISKETFAAAEEKRERNKIQKIRETRYNALLQGVAYCGVCGKKLVFHHFYDRTKSDNSNEYYFYKCHNGDNRIMRADIVDAIVWEALSKLCKSERAIKTYAAKQTPPDAKIDVNKELQRIDEQRAAVVTWFTQNYITAEQATAKLEALKQKQKILQAQAVKKDNIDAAKIRAIMKPKKLTYAEKRNAILQVCSKIFITRAGGKYGKKYELKIDFVFK